MEQRLARETTDLQIFCFVIFGLAMLYIYGWEHTVVIQQSWVYLGAFYLYVYSNG